MDAHEFELEDARRRITRAMDLIRLDYVDDSVKTLNLLQKITSNPVDYLHLETGFTCGELCVALIITLQKSPEFFTFLEK